MKKKQILSRFSGHGLKILAIIGAISAIYFLITVELPLNVEIFGSQVDLIPLYLKLIFVILVVIGIAIYDIYSSMPDEEDSSKS